MPMRLTLSLDGKAQDVPILPDTSSEGEEVEIESMKVNQAAASKM